LLNALSDGLVLLPRPFLELGRRAGCTEGDAMASIETLIRDGFVARFGLIVRHRALGITANAMTVFDIPERELEEFGARLAAEAAITLCYARRRAPGWNYNLYTMVHGRERGAVSAQIDAIARRCGVAHLPRATLFSRRCFKQTGASLRAA
jgi:DNA-binding Lrp family transcriptional regulator